MIVFEKFGQHQPLNRQADRYALEGVLARIAGHPVHRLDELLPWNWRQAAVAGVALAA